MREAPILVDGEVIQTLKPELYKVRLPNGKITLGHLSKKLRALESTFENGHVVRLEMTPFDFDSGRIVSLSEKS
ncbi:MAG: translation initiation factor IF-1 [Verrucomicrobiota bacterium]